MVLMSSSTQRAAFRYGSLRPGNIVPTSEVSPPQVEVNSASMGCPLYVAMRPAVSFTAWSLSGSSPLKPLYAWHAGPGQMS